MTMNTPTFPIILFIPFILLTEYHQYPNNKKSYEQQQQQQKQDMAIHENIDFDMSFILLLACFEASRLRLAIEKLNLLSIAPRNMWFPRHAILRCPSFPPQMIARQSTHNQSIFISLSTLPYVDDELSPESTEKNSVLKCTPRMSRQETPNSI